MSSPRPTEPTDTGEAAALESTGQVGDDSPEALVPRLREASRHVVRELGLLRREDRDTGCSPSQCHALIELEQHGELTVGELAGILQQDKSTASRAIQPLADEGWVRADQDPADHRSKLVFLTEEGRRKVRSLHESADRQVREALAVLSDEERRIVLEGMQLYAKALGRARHLAGIVVRPIREIDSAPLARIIRKVMSEHGVVGEGFPSEDAEIDAMHAAYSRPRTAYFVAEREGKLLGGAGIGPLEGAGHEICELRKMYVLPEGRGIGLGRRLLELSLDTARKEGFTTCYLETMETMTQARSLYAKVGFQPQERPLGSTGHFGCNRWAVREL